jgi:antitoxin (DNA-binding transcriptional repressor) of toxin-antitoxin stability system
MKTLTVSEAAGNLAEWMNRAVAGEEIAIRCGDSLVTLHPVSSSVTTSISPRKALQQLQQEAHLTSQEAGDYLKEVRAERIAADSRTA